jgi:hypothetical protein
MDKFLCFYKLDWWEYYCAKTIEFVVLPEDITVEVMLERLNMVDVIKQTSKPQLKPIVEVVVKSKSENLVEVNKESKPVPKGLSRIRMPSRDKPGF